MRQRSLAGAVMTVALLLVPTLPAQAAAPLPEEPHLVWFDSSGAWGVGPRSELPADGSQVCLHNQILGSAGTLISPLENTCTLSDHASSGWVVGWTYPPPIVPSLAGVFVGSWHVTLTGSNGGKAEFRCNVVVVGANGFFVPPFVGVKCALDSFVLPMGTLTASFWNGGSDPSLVVPGAPSAAKTLIPVGSWEALLQAY